MIWHKKLTFHCTTCEEERLFSILIHKSVENDRTEKRSGSAVCLIFINQITSLEKCMMNDYKSAKSHNNGKHIQFS